MKTFTHYLFFNTKEKKEFILITPQINELIKKSGIKDGFVLINPMHITSAIIVNDNETGLISDFFKTLERIVPYHANYSHNISEDNAAAHIWRQLIGHQITMAITNGKLDLGPWEQIFYCEFDGQRKKRVLVKMLGE
jgi:secondary thiamine-phosphate synthase enzyme